MNIIQNYNEALQKLYDHVGFKGDWVICPIDDCTEMFWDTNGKVVRYAETKKKFNSDEDYCSDDVYTQRFYSKHIYDGLEYLITRKD